MKKIFIIITLAAIFPLSGCASFKQIDTTDVIPNKNQINAQLSAEKAKEKAYTATKGTYPDTMVQPVTTTTTTTTTTLTPTQQPVTSTPVQLAKPVKIVDVVPSSTTPVTTTSVPVSSTPAVATTVTTTPISSTPAVIISSTAKKPIREIIIYPDDTPPQDVTVKPASKTQTVVVTPTASKTVTASKTPVVAIIPADTTGTEVIYKVLVGKFPTKDAVEPLLAELKETYKEAFIKKNETKEEYSVQIAASTNEKATNILVAKLKEKGYKIFVLTVKK
jgi:cell division septation protein DedD